MGRFGVRCVARANQGDERESSKGDEAWEEGAAHRPIGYHGATVRSLFRLAGLALLVGSLLAVETRAAGEPPPEIVANVECARLVDPGRVRCEVEVRSSNGRPLRWAEVVVVEAPPFAPPLRARVGPAEATTHEDSVWRWAIALAARGRGAGALRVRVRGVSCAGAACTPFEVEARGEVAVGEP